MAEIVSSLVIAITARNLARQAIADTVNDLGGMINQFKNAQAQTINTAEQTRLMSNAYAQMGNTVKALELKATIADFEYLAKAQGIAAASAEMEAGAIGTLITRLAAAGPEIAVVGIAIGLVVGAFNNVADAATKFDYNMRIIQNNTTNSEANFNALKQSVISLAGSTGASMDDIANAYRHAANEGFSFAEQQKLVATATQLAVAEGAKVADVTQQVGRVMNDTGLDMNNVAGATNLFAMAAKQGDVTLQQFTDSSGRMTAITGALDAGITDVYGAYDALSRSGFNAATAQTQMLGLLKAIVEPTGSAEKEIKKLANTTGIDLVRDFSLAGLQEKGLVAIMADLQAATAGDTSEIFKLVPALRGGQAAIALTTSGFQYMTEAANNNAAALRGELNPALSDFNLTTATTQQKSQMLAERFAGLKIAIGEPVSELKGTVTTAFLQIGQGFDALGAKLGPLKNGFATMVLPLGAFIDLLKVAGGTSDLLAQALNGLRLKFADLLEAAKPAWAAIANSDAGKTAQSLIQGIHEKVQAFINGPLKAEQDAADAAWAAVANTAAAQAAAGAMATVEGAIASLGSHFQWLADLANTAWAAIQRATGAALDTRWTGGGASSMPIAGEHAASEQQAYNDQLRSGVGYLTQLAQAQNTATETQGRALAATGALNTAKAAQNAIDSQYAGMTLPRLKSAQESLNADLKDEQGIRSQLQDQLAAANKANDAKGIRDNTAALDQNNQAMRETQRQLDGVNHALDQYKAANGGAGGAAKQAAQNTNAARNALADTTSTLEQFLLLTKAVTDHLKSEYVPAIDNAKIVLDGLKTKLIAVTDEVRTQTIALNIAKTVGLEPYKAAVQAAENAIKDQQVVIERQNLAIRAQQDQVKAANDELTAYKNTLTGLTEALTAATSAETQFSQAILPGAQAFSDQADSIKTNIEQIQLQMDQIVATDMSKGMTKSAAETNKALAPLQQRLDSLNLQLNIVNTQSSLALDPMKKQIADLTAQGNTFDFSKIIDQLTKAQSAGQQGLQPLIAQLTTLSGQSKATLTMQQITQGITLAQQAELALNQSIPSANAQVITQQTVVDRLNTTLESMQKHLQSEQDALTGLQKNLEAATKAEQEYQKTLTDKQAALDELKANEADLKAQTEAGTQAVKDAQDEYRKIVDTISTQVAPITDLLREKQLVQRDVVRQIITDIKSGHVPALSEVATMMATNTTPRTEELGKTLSDILGVSLVDVNGKLTIAGSNSGTLADDLKTILNPALVDSGSVATTAAGKLDEWTNSVLSGQAAAAKGIDLTVRVHTVQSGGASGGGGGGGGPAPTYTLGGTGTMAGSGSQIFTSQSFSGMSFGGIAVSPTPLAGGGFIDHPTFALLGEAGPEVVLPLSELGPAQSQQIIIQINNPQIWQAQDLNNLVDQIGRQIAQRYLPGAGFVSQYR